MKLITVILFALVSASAFAGEPTMSGAGSKFDQLNEMFTKGNLPSFEEMKGWWSGRCFNSTAPDNALGFILMVWEKEKKTGGNDGPLFPPEVEKLNLIVLASHNNGQGAEPGRYDQLTDSDRTELLGLANSDGINVLVSFELDGSWVVSNGSRENRLKKFEGYYIVQASDLKDNGTEKVRDHFETCYFFKKVN